MPRQEETPETENIADRTEGAAAAGAFGVDGRSIMDAWGSIFEQASTHPRALLAAGGQFAAEIGSIWFGESTISLDGVDKRFRDDKRIRFRRRCRGRPVRVEADRPGRRP